MSAAGEPFSAANSLGAVNYQQFDELTYWDPDTDSDNFDEGEYILYLTEPGANEPFFERATISFAFDTEYVLALRTTTAAIQDNVVVDLIINSSALANYADEDATAQYRVYYSLDNAESISLSLAGNDGTTEDMTLSANTLSDFSEVEFGDYRLTAILGDVGFNNRLVTLNQGESKAVILYRGEEETLNSISFEESNLPQVFDHQIQIVNLTPDFHELIAVFDDNNDTQVLLDRTELLGINEEVNYIITVEKTDDSDTGFKISILY